MLRKSISLIALAALAFGITAATPAHAQLNLTLNPTQGFYFQKNVQQPCGFLTTLGLGTTTLTPDFVVTNPTTLTTFKAAAVLTSVSWSGKLGDPITIAGRISRNNRDAVIAWEKNHASTAVTFGANCFTYDLTNMLWYKNFYDQAGAMHGFVAHSGATLEISVSSTAATDVLLPMNYKFTITVVPSTLTENFVYATSSTSSVVRSW